MAGKMSKAAYGKMEKMLGKKDVEKGMKEGSKKDMAKDVKLMKAMKKK